MAEKNSKSAFVNTLAWISIACSGFAVVISLLQNLMIFLLVPREEMREALNQASASEHMPNMIKFMFAHFELLFMMFFIGSILMLVVSVGLLNRKNWARLAFIALMGLSILSNFVGLALQQVFMSQMSIPADAPADFQEVFHTIQTLSLVFGTIFSLGFSALFGWTIWRLRTPEIVEEFKPKMIGSIPG